MITNTLTTIRRTRTHLLGIIKDLTADQLNKVPAGFNNNIIWNLAHLISAQQGICYTRAGKDIAVDDKYFSPYRPDTKPVTVVDDAEIADIKSLLLTSIDQLETDYNAGVFADYTAWISRYGIDIDNIDDAISFLPFHDGMHIGYIMALKRVIAIG